MIKKIQSIRGMNDYLPLEASIWQYIEKILKDILIKYGYKEIRLPIVEHTALFQRAIGEITDVVEKQMYSFEDRNGDNLTLRPEGTAGCVRASIQHGLYHQEQRLWYIGPMFRHERPQKGRYRQFHQIGAEVFGLKGPNIDAELIALTARWWRALGIAEHISLELNSIGSLKSRHNYKNALVAFLEQNQFYLDTDYQRLIYKNPLRILDSKNLKIKEILNSAPNLEDYLDNESREHFLMLCNILEKIGISYTINQRLVRGLDYYNRTVFEWITNSLGSQRTVCAGGRYDHLVEQFGGHKTPAVGFAMGLERLILLMRTINPKFQQESIFDICVITLGKETQLTGIKISECIRDAFPGIKLITNFSESNLKKQFSRANKNGVRIALVLGKSEILSSTVVVKVLKTGKLFF